MEAIILYTYFINITNLNIIFVFLLKKSQILILHGVGIKCPAVDMQEEDAKAFANRNLKMKIIGHGQSPVPDVYWAYYVLNLFNLIKNLQKSMCLKGLTPEVRFLKAFEWFSWYFIEYFSRICWDVTKI